MGFDLLARGRHTPSVAGTLSASLRDLHGRDPYQILGVSRDATSDDIAKAYRDQVRRLHPDSPTGNHEAAALLNLARDILTDPASRADYDRSTQGPSAAPREEGGPRPSAWDEADVTRSATGPEHPRQPQRPETPPMAGGEQDFPATPPPIHRETPFEPRPPQRPRHFSQPTFPRLLPRRPPPQHDPPPWPPFPPSSAQPGFNERRLGGGWLTVGKEWEWLGLVALISALPCPPLALLFGIATLRLSVTPKARLYAVAGICLATICGALYCAGIGASLLNDVKLSHK